jgi:hypothetical protein
MKYLRGDTVAYFKSLPQLQKVDLGGIEVRHFAEGTQEYRVHCSKASPDAEALRFYLANHLYTVISSKFSQNSPLPQNVVNVLDWYRGVLENQGQRMLHYMLSITTREMRHLKYTQVTSGFWGSLEKTHGVEIADFIKGICSLSESEAVDKYMKHPPKCSISNYINGLAYAFNHGAWNGGFGGKKWGKVAEVCAEFIDGKISMEAMVDTGYTLAHNNGPIFNKGMMYSMYTGSFITLLDVQRSGQIPSLLLDSADYGIKKDSEAVSVLGTAVSCGLEFSPFVDWHKVEALGSVNKYPQFKEHQKKHTPKESLPVTKFGKFKAKQVGTWGVFPGQAVPVFERVKK